ncbi:MAG: NUDIX hydrolase [Bacteroidetes bacterium]|nr:NUDIX hydrolase [Bacteroidota bacterium]
MKNTVQTFYGNRLRVRVCGVCVHEERLLMVNHHGITNSNFWAPPGGGIEFGESAIDCLKREFKEETGLDIHVDRFLFACEFIAHPLHAIELFFNVTYQSAKLRKGADPEPGSPQVIQDVKFISWDEIAATPTNELHGIFKMMSHPSEITTLNGYFKV